MLEIRWHGRGGQGTKSASHLLAKIFFELGFFSQGFPFFGAERSGAPIIAYNRVDRNRIRNHEGISSPNCVIIVDSSQINKKCMDNIGKNGIYILNTKKSENEIREELNISEDKKIYCIDADTIAKRNIGKAFPNYIMLFSTIFFLSKKEKKFDEDIILDSLNILIEEINDKFKNYEKMKEVNISAVYETFEILKEKYV